MGSVGTDAQGRPAWAAPISYRDKLDSIHVFTCVGPCIDTWRVDDNDRSLKEVANDDMGCGVLEYLFKCKVLTTFGTWLPFDVINPFHPLTRARFTDVPGHGTLGNTIPSLPKKEIIHTFELEQFLSSKAVAASVVIASLPKEPTDHELAIPYGDEMMELKRRIGTMDCSVAPPMYTIIKEDGLTTRTLRWVFATLTNLGYLKNVWIPRLLRFHSASLSTLDYNPPILCVFEDAYNEEAMCWVRGMTLTSVHSILQRKYHGDEDHDMYFRALMYKRQYNAEFNE